MEAVAETMDPLVFTDAAAIKVKSLIDEEGNRELKIGVFLGRRHVLGFQYGFTFDVETAGEDSVRRSGVTLLVDAMSLQYLMGAEIDYKDDLDGAQFVIKNPNASSTCGCGSSFS